MDDISLELEEGVFLSLLGPSGCGKTTTLRMVAGLEIPSGGQIVVDGQIVSDGVRVLAPERRNTGMVFQSYAIWPHMTVFENVAYGLKLKKWPKDAIRKKVLETLGLVGMDRYQQRYPTELSGGQQQRVALARALALEPSILLLDEPLSNLDALLRESMRFEIRQLQKRLGITALYVTHSQEEALAVSDTIGVMAEGKILQLGTPEEIYNFPRTRFVASFIGIANFLRLKRVGMEEEYHVFQSPAEGDQIRVKKIRTVPESPELTVMIRPERIRLSKEAPACKETNQLKAVLEKLTFTGNMVDYFLRFQENTLRVQSTPPITAQEGDQVFLTFSPDDCVLMDD